MILRSSETGPRIILATAPRSFAGAPKVFTPFNLRIKRDNGAMLNPIPALCVRRLNLPGWLLRWDYGLLALLLLPLAFTILDRNWLFSGCAIDSWGYFGYYLNLTNFFTLFDGTYYVTRLSAILPGWLAYGLLPPLVANCVLHLAHYYASVISLYMVLRTTVHRRAALLASLTMGCDPWFLQSMGSDYVVSAGITYYMLTMLFLTLATQSPWWRAHLLAAGVFAAALFVANTLFVLFLPFLLAFYLVQSRQRQPHPCRTSLIYVGLGFVVFLLALSIINHSITGRFWFLLPSLHLSTPSLKTYQVPSLFKDPTWFLAASWLLYPVLIGLGGVILLMQAVFGRGQRRSHVILFYQLQLVVLLVGFALLDSPWHNSLLRIPFYVCSLLPVALLAFSGQIDQLTTHLHSLQFRVITAVAALALIGAAFLPRIEPNLQYPRIFPLAPFLATWTLAGGILILLNRKTLAFGTSVAVFSMLGVCVYMSRAIYPGCYTSDTERTIDHNRPAALLAVVQGIRAVQLANPSGKVWFWYDQRAPLANLYLMLACAHQSGLILPDITLTQVLPVTAPGKPRPGTRLVLLSNGDNTVTKTSDALQKLGVEVRVLTQTAVDQSPFSFTLTVVETLDASARPPVEDAGSS